MAAVLTKQTALAPVLFLLFWAFLWGGPRGRIASGLSPKVAAPATKVLFKVLRRWPKAA